MIDVSFSKPLLAVAGICTWTAVLISIYQVRKGWLVEGGPRKREKEEGERTRREKTLEKNDGIDFFVSTRGAGTQKNSSTSTSTSTSKHKTQIIQHLRHYTEPLFQRYIVRIVFMVPFYSVTSFFSLLFPVAAPYLDTVRDCYEVRFFFFFSFSFLSFLLSPFRLTFSFSLSLSLLTRPGSSTTSSLFAWLTSEEREGSSSQCRDSS